MKGSRILISINVVELPAKGEGGVKGIPVWSRSMDWYKRSQTIEDLQSPTPYGEGGKTGLAFSKQSR